SSTSAFREGVRSSQAARFECRGRPMCLPTESAITFEPFEPFEPPSSLHPDDDLDYKRCIHDIVLKRPGRRRSTTLTLIAKDTPYSTIDQPQKKPAGPTCGLFHSVT